MWTVSASAKIVEDTDIYKNDPGTSNVSCHCTIFSSTVKVLPGHDARSLLEEESPGDGHATVFVGNSIFECNTSANTGTPPDPIGKVLLNP